MLAAYSPRSYRTDAFGELIAFHYFTAVAGEDADLAWDEIEREPIRQKAFRHLMSAGTQARRRFALAKAIELHQQAASLATTEEEKLGAAEESGDDNWTGYHGDSAKDAYTAAVEALKADGSLPRRVQLRQCKYLNNIIEQDHRNVKKRAWLAKGYGSFQSAWRTLQGIETIHMIRKGIVRWLAAHDAAGQALFIAELFGIADY